VTVLVTGGAGYIGSHTVRALWEQGRSVVVLDNLEGGHRAAVAGTPLVVGDVADDGLVRTVVAEHGVTACIHFAAHKAAGESMANPGRYFANNVGSTNALLEALRLGGVGHVVFSSTAAVYGTPEVLPVTESSPIAPESPYGESKAMAERILDWYDACHGMRSVRLRYFNAAGASEDASIGEDWSVTLNLVPLVMKAALERIGQLSLYGTDYPTRDGTAIRDYVHVSDLADAHVKALDHLEAGRASTTLNLGTGRGSTVREVLDAARAASGLPIPVVEVDRRPGDPTAVWADTSKALEVLGWKATRDLDVIVGSAWAWHSTHPDGYETRPRPT